MGVELLVKLHGHSNRLLAKIQGAYIKFNQGCLMCSYTHSTKICNELNELLENKYDIGHTRGLPFREFISRISKDCSDSSSDIISDYEDAATYNTAMKGEEVKLDTSGPKEVDYNAKTWDHSGINSMLLLMILRVICRCRLLELGGRRRGRFFKLKIMLKK